MKRKAGRKTLLNRRMIKKVSNSLMSCNTRKTTCLLVGISEETFYRWMREGEEQKAGIKREFYESVNKALASCKMTLVENIQNSDKWQAQAWLLERMFPDEYGRRRLLAHAEIADEPPIEIKASQQPIVSIIMQTPAEGDSWICDKPTHDNDV